MNTFNRAVIFSSKSAPTLSSSIHFLVTLATRSCIINAACLPSSVPPYEQRWEKYGERKGREKGILWNFWVHWIVVLVWWGVFPEWWMIDTSLVVFSQIVNLNITLNKFQYPLCFFPHTVLGFRCKPLHKFIESTRFYYLLFLSFKGFNFLYYYIIVWLWPNIYIFFLHLCECEWLASVF